MAPRANSQSRVTRRHPDPQKPRKSNPTELIRRAIAILVLANTSAELSILCLSPVYGSIPASMARTWQISILQTSKLQISLQVSLPTAAALYLIYLSRIYLNKSQLAILTSYLPIFGFCIPTILSFLLSFSDVGPTWGPVLVSFCTSSPLLYLSILSLLDTAEEFYLGQMASPELEAPRLGRSGNLVYWQLPFIIGCYCIMDKIQDLSSLILSHLVREWSRRSVVFSRFGLLAVVSLSYATLERSYKRFAFVGILPLLHTIFVNPHVPLAYNTAVLNATLQAEGYSLVARQESLTGYISVLDNVRDGFRAMRCGHSLLGGEWIEKPKVHPSILNEPIYAIFVMLEAVRLVETRFSTTTAEHDKKALVIGLGVGTAPAALIAHGIATTTIEIDPVVHSFAAKYFDLPRNHTPVIGDAIEVVHGMQTGDTEKSRYDYIIHDVFTGGVEPIDLFTEEFLTELRELLTPDGVIAINYAGDMLLPSARSVINTVLHVFPSCRLFRETPAPKTLGMEDFTNLVIFCMKSSSPITFRAAVESDFLGSPARRQHLVPQHEVHYTFFGPRSRRETNVIRRGQTKSLEASQMRSAVGHWYVMRSQVPRIVWENW